MPPECACRGAAAGGRTQSSAEKYVPDPTPQARVHAVSAGYLHTLGLLGNGTVRAAGHPEFWSGVENWTGITAVAAGSCHSVGLRADGTVVATGMSEAGQCEVNRWHDIVAIAAGAAHTVGLRADGGVVATGSNSHGQLEVGAWSAG